jgi:hypothetical protein
MHVLAGTVDSFVDSDVVAWRVGVEGVDVTNRRRHIRVPAEGHIDITIGGTRLSIELIDISESGVRCRWRDDDFPGSDAESSERERALQEALGVTVAIDISPDQRLTLPGSVAWVREGDQGVEFSVAFVCLNEDDKMTELLRRHVLTLEREQLRRSRSQ